MQRHPLIQTVGIATLYFLASLLPQIPSILPGNIAILFPAAGIALALSYGMGPFALWGIFIGAVLGAATPDLLRSASVGTFWISLASIGVGVGAALQAWAGSWALQRFIGEKKIPPLKFFGLLAVIAPTSAVISAAIGVTSKALPGIIPPDAVTETLSVWWFGDTTGMLMFTQATLYIRQRMGGVNRRPVISLLAILSAVAAIIVVSAAVNLHHVYTSEQEYIQAIAILALIAMITIGFSAILFWKITDPMINMIELKFAEIEKLAHDRTQQLRNEMEHTEIMVQSIPGAVYECIPDADWTTVYFSDYIEKLTGYPASDFVMNKVRTYESIIVQDDKLTFNDEIYNVAKSGGVYEVRYRIHHANGDIRWLLDRGCRSNHEVNGQRLLCGTLVDVTLETQAREAVEEKQRTLEVKLRELEDFNRLAVGRELRMIELKQEINALADKAGIARPYPDLEKYEQS